MKDARWAAGTTTACCVTDLSLRTLLQGHRCVSRGVGLPGRAQKVSKGGLLSAPLSSMFTSLMQRAIQAKSAFRLYMPLLSL